MSWFSQKVYTEEEVRSSFSCPLPCRFQIGTDVWLHLFNKDGTGNVIDAVVGGVNFSAMHEIKYDLYIKIGEKLYVRINGFRGFISGVGEYLDSDGGLISSEELMSNIQGTLVTTMDLPKQPHLSLVTTKKES